MKDRPDGPSSLQVADPSTDCAYNPESLKNLAKDFDVAYKRWEKKKGLNLGNQFKKHQDFKSRH